MTKSVTTTLHEGALSYSKVTMNFPSFRLEDKLPRAVLDKVFLGYYLFQIVSTLGLDIQGTFPAFIFPSFLRSLHTHHCETWHDPFLEDTVKHPWYFAICLSEYTLHVPFYFFAARAYYNRVTGVDRSRWIKIPAVMYCTQTITATSSIMLMALFEDFTDYSSPSVPSGLYQRLKLAGVYFLFFGLCLLNLTDVLTERETPLPPQPQPPARRRD